MNTDCSWPAVQPFHAAPLGTCTSAEGSPITIEWSSEAKEVDCAGDKCVAAPFDVAVGSTGEVWTSAHLLPSVALDIEAPIGFEVLRNDASGTLELEQPTHALGPLYEPTMDAVGMSVTESGELDWVGPSPSSSGLSLLHYDRAGARVSARWIIEHADKSVAHFGSHGITIVYRYVTGVDTTQDPPEVTHDVGVARFDAKGSSIVWNQAAFPESGLPLDFISLVGVGTDGAVTVTVHEQEAGALLVRVASDGHVEWVREMDRGVWLGAHNPLNDTFVLAGQGQEAGMVVDGIDAQGNGIWRTATGAWFADALVVSEQGKIFLRTPTGEPTIILSPDGASCTQHALDIELYLSIPTAQFDEAWSTDPVFARLSNERFAFAYSGRSGVLKLPW